MNLEKAVEILFNETNKDKFIETLKHIYKDKLSNENSKYRMMRKFIELLEEGCGNIENKYILKSEKYNIIAYEKAYVFLLTEFMSPTLTNYTDLEKKEILFTDEEIKDFRNTFVQSSSNLLNYTIEFLSNFSKENINIQNSYERFEYLEEVERIIEMSKGRKAFNLMNKKVNFIIFKERHMDWNSISLPATYNIVLSNINKNENKAQVLLHELGHILNYAVTGTFIQTPKNFGGEELESVPEENRIEIFCDIFSYYSMKDTELHNERPLKEIEHLEVLNRDYNYIKDMLE